MSRQVQARFILFPVDVSLGCKRGVALAGYLAQSVKTLVFFSLLINNQAHAQTCSKKSLNSDGIKATIPLVGLFRTDNIEGAFHKYYKHS
jgi:hypothetical protein